MKLKILIQTPDLSEGDGIANVIMGQYDELIKNECIVDFAENDHNASIYTDKVDKNGGNFILFGSLKDRRKIKNLIKYGNYDIVHINYGCLLSYILVYYAKKYKVKKIIWHSHNTKHNITLKNKIRHYLNYFFGVKKSNCYLACTEKAGKDIFGNKSFKILNNAINTKKFSFNYEKRTAIRNKYKIEDDCFVIGTVCRYSIQKNPIFMLDIIKEMKKHRKIKFMWVGSSNDYAKEIFDYIEKNNLKDDVILVGKVSDTSTYYNAMDSFIMPSFWEGLGIAYIEAQANGLPTYGSNAVPKEAALTKLFSSLPIDKGISIWVNKIMKNNIRTDEKDSSIYAMKQIFNNGYALENYCGKLYEIYTYFFNDSEE